MDLNPYLKIMAEKNASDLFFSTNATPCIKIEGTTAHMGQTPLPPGAVKQLAYSIMNDEQIKSFEETLEMDLAISAKDTGRFRVNVFRQRGEVAMVVRYITANIKSVEQLSLPSALNDLVMAPRGLVLVVGTTGSGKSTTLASMINYRNRNKTGHILTIEDPIEFTHNHQKAIVNQREVGLDTLSYSSALRRAMREAPDVIMIGEIRDKETMQQALAYADTGHLCLSTLHATNGSQTLERIINFFPEKAHYQLRMDLSLNLKAIISQRLIIGTDKKRLPAVELLINTPHIADLIQKGNINEIQTAIEQGNDVGMQTFDQALFDLYQAEKISLEEALEYADSHNNLSLKVRLAQDGTLDMNEPDNYCLAPSD